MAASQLFISPIKAEARKLEIKALALLLSSVAPDLNGSARSVLLDKLLDAVGRAKPGPDLAKAAVLDAAGREWVRRCRHPGCLVHSPEGSVMSIEMLRSFVLVITHHVLTPGNAATHDSFIDTETT